MYSSITNEYFSKRKKQSEKKPFVFGIILFFDYTCCERFLHLAKGESHYFSSLILISLRSFDECSNNESFVLSFTVIPSKVLGEGLHPM